MAHLLEKMIGNGTDEVNEDTDGDEACETSQIECDFLLFLAEVFDFTIGYTANELV